MAYEPISASKTACVPHSTSPTPEPGGTRQRLGTHPAPRVDQRGVRRLSPRPHPSSASAVPGNTHPALPQGRDHSPEDGIGEVPASGDRLRSALQLSANPLPGLTRQTSVDVGNDAEFDLSELQRTDDGITEDDRPLGARGNDDRAVTRVWPGLASTFTPEAMTLPSAIDSIRLCRNAWTAPQRPGPHRLYRTKSPTHPDQPGNGR